MGIFNRQRSGYAENGITEGVIWKQILMFFFPILLGTFFQQLYNTVDAIIVGKYVGTGALAAVGGATGSVINLIVGFFVGVSSGATVILSQYYGARNARDVNRSTHTAIALALSFGALLTAAGFILTPALLRMTGTNDEVMEYAVPYMRIYFLGMIPALVYNIGSGLLRAVGDSRRPLYFLIASCLTNIVLDLLLVVVFGMGVAGAALATIIAEAVSAVLVFITLMHTNDSYRLFPKQIRFHKDLLGHIIRIGLPAGVNSSLYSVSNLIIQTSINSFGTRTMAGWTAWTKLDGFVWMVLGAFGASITTFMGQNFGAGKVKRMKKSVWIVLAMSVGATLLLSGAFLLFGPSLFHIFTDEEEVVAAGMDMLHSIASYFVLYVGVEIISGALRGAGDSLVPTLMTLGGICAFRLVWVLFITPMHNTLSFMLTSYPISWVMTSTAFYVYYFIGRWLKRCQKRFGVKFEE